MTSWEVKEYNGF